MNTATDTSPDWSPARPGAGTGLVPELIGRDLNTRIVGSSIICHERVESTNDIAARLAKEGAPEGTLVLAEEQSKGRGRLGRRWQAPPGSSLLMSIVFYPPLLPSQAQRVAMVCSLGALAGIGLATGLQAQMKWPNDILIQGRKVAGSLVEAAVYGSELSYVVAGIGLNVNLDPALLEDVAAPATSLAQELGHLVDRVALLRHILRETDARYLRLLQGWSPREEWAANLSTLGQSITVHAGDEVLRGTAEGVNEDGALLLRDPGGTLHRLRVGDVTSHPPSVGRPM